MDSWSSRTIVMPTMPYTSWTGRSCAESGWSSNMPAARGETEMAMVGVTGVVGAVSAVYYKMPSLSLPPGVRCPCGLHRELFVLQSNRLREFEARVHCPGLWPAVCFPMLMFYLATPLLWFGACKPTPTEVAGLFLFNSYIEWCDS